MYTYLVKQFKDYLLEQLQKYERQKQRRVTLDEFGEYLGVSRTLVSYWLNGRNLPSPENAKLIAKKLGMEVYDYLDMPRPDPDLAYLTDIWQTLTPKQRSALKEQASSYVTKNEKGKRNANSTKSMEKQK